ncbi:NUDIX domain-containing protein [Rhizobium miluonense]|uniref:Nudix hydrolase domain-containing protein n=1 Tax=Rhizobium miluonense TaxID=411945 RepID=A0A1C3UD22_9HYPH|nr:NUDIX domain-containing protein [Rhizobium miluonense]SCB13349.1 hypothetical protein GA0061102_100310 [Rhizobium miluonense]
MHRSAGKQFVKGTIEINETPVDAAKHELWEESGLAPLSWLAGSTRNETLIRACVMAEGKVLIGDVLPNYGDWFRFHG